MPVPASRLLCATNNSSLPLLSFLELLVNLLIEQLFPLLQDFWIDWRAELGEDLRVLAWCTFVDHDILTSSLAGDDADAIESQRAPR